MEIKIQKPDIKYTKLFINNEFVESLSGKTFPTYSPINEELICHVQEADKADVDRAVYAAKVAFKQKSIWRTMDASNRGELLYKLSVLVEQNKNYLANLETLENGMPYIFALQIIENLVKLLRYYAGWADKLQGKTIPANGPFSIYTLKEPIGVCALILPFNGPSYFFGLKLSMALCTGNTVVIKPAEQTPLTALFLASLALEAGFPPGVVNVVNGYGNTTGAALVGHTDVAKISFTGSTSAAKIIQTIAAKSSFKKLTFETGGKSPFVIFDDCDIEEAIMTAHQMVFLQSGQACISPSRLFVQDTIYNTVLKKIVNLANLRRVGNPFDPKSEQGPIIDKIKFNNVMAYIKLGIDEGANLLAGGNRHGDLGYYIQPTVFSEVTDDMVIAKEEIFGPVQLIFKFSTLDEVIERCNKSSYGLAAGIFTQDIKKAMKFAQEVQTGVVYVNNYLANLNFGIPLGGVKESGFGREFGEDGLEEYLQIKSVAIKM